MTEAVAAEPTTRERLLDATARVLIELGQAEVSTRRIAEEAGVAHGLIRYHFGSLDGLMAAAFERACAQVLDRQRALYVSEGPFLEKWRAAMRFIDADLDVGFPKLVAELMARSWNDPTWQPAIRELMAGFDDVLAGAIRAATHEYGIHDADVAALTTLLRTFQLGVLIDRVSGVDMGHAHLDEVIDRWLAGLADAARSRAPERAATATKEL